MKSLRFRSIVAVLFLMGAAEILFAQTAGPTRQETAAFQAAVDAAYRTWCDTNINPDLERFIALWDENAVKMATGKPTLHGAAQIRVFKRKAFGMVVYDRFEINVEEYQLAGQFGWARGTYRITTHPKAGGQGATAIGTYLTVFKRQPDGTWKVYRDTMMAAPE